MPPLPYEQLIELQEADKRLLAKKTMQAGKSVRSSAQSPQIAQTSKSGICKTSPALQKDMPPEKPRTHLELQKTVSEEMDTMAANPEISLQNPPVLSRNNDSRRISPPLKQDRLLRETEPESPAESQSETSVEKPGTLSQASSRNYEQINQDNVHVLKRPKKRLKVEAENGALPSQRHPVPQNISNSARRGSWPQICSGQGPRGLYNPHNYCYRRSVLQALLHLPSFLQNCACVACGLKKLSITYWTSNNRALITNAVKAFDILANNRSDSKWSGKRWRTTDQMDAQEWCLFLLDQMVDPQVQKNSKSKSHMDRPLRRPEVQADLRSFKEQMKDVFELSYSQTMTCGACRVSRRFHGLQKILGPLPLASSNSGHKDISSCLKQFFSTDLWEVKCENNRCPKFNKPEIKNRVVQSIVAAPEVLMIQLKCFMVSGKRTAKKNPNIDFGHDLSLSRYASQALLEREGEINYKLSSVVIHQGSSLESGHYVGIFTSPTGQVYHISDENVSRVSSNALTGTSQKGTPYILCYTRIRAVEKEAVSNKAGSAQRQNSGAVISKPEHRTNRSKSRPNDNSIQRRIFGAPIITKAKPAPPSDGLPNGFRLKTCETQSIASLPQVKFLGDQSTLPMLPNLFELSQSRPPFYPRDPRSNMGSIRDLAGMRDGRPKPSQQTTNKLQDYQGLSKNQIRKLKKRQRRLLDNK
ncbi:hypothetical protein EG328_003571 [Venturia inaequalis]|uniref:USP domain-containing protein n=1 Tax=Venturia inaequalis TaxID=5025 RepID=A0A8H3USS2_VENIN|nr:hypothetical protein EG328_003571 [Venturia inaequalis]